MLSARELEHPPRGASKWPSVSVVIATRDRPALLERAVRSVLEQDYPGFIECLVVFDQSTPRAPAVRSGPRRRLRVLINGRTPGLPGARNEGALASRSHVLAFCDDDDEWLPEKLRLQIPALASPDTHVVSSGIEVHFKGRSIERLPPAATVSHRDLLRSRVMEMHPSTVVVERPAFLDRIGLVDEQIPGGHGEDYDWLLRAARVAPVVAVRRPLVRVHWHESSWFSGRWSTIVAAQQYLLEKHPEFQAEPYGLARIYGQISFALAASGQSRAARRWARRSLALNWRERRGYIAILVSTGIVEAATIMRLANAFGRGI